MPNVSKITKAERIEEMVLIHVWLSDIKALPGRSKMVTGTQLQTV
jgi:hypothetical protein